MKILKNIRRWSFLLLVHWLSLPMNAQIAAVEVDKGDEKSTVEDIIIVFKMHFDIGYTDWAESILQKYATSMMDETLRSVEATKHLSENEQFVWTLPGWPMKYICENASQENLPKIEDALRKGRFSVHALPFTWETEASDLESLVRGMSFSSQINRKYGLPLTRGAKLTDVPSHSWVLPTLLSQAGVKILHIGCNPGSTSPDVPTLFWWEGPDGSRVLTFNWAEYYGSGVMPPVGWKHKTWLAMIHTHENSGAPDPQTVADVLKEAHEKAPNARVRIGRIEDFYDALMKENPSLPVVRGDMPDTWIHGFMSMPREMKINKNMQRAIYNAEILNTQLKHWNVTPEFIKPYVDRAVEQSLLFDEHSFGIALSHGDQGAWKYGDSFTIDRGQGLYDFAEVSWYEKGNRARQAQISIIPSFRKDLKKMAQNVAMDGRKILVYNTLPWNRSGNVSFHMGVYKKDFQIYGLKDESDGSIVPVYNDYNHLSFYAKDVPSLGYKTYSLLTEPLADVAQSVRIDEVESVLENRFFKVRINKENGALLSVWDKQQRKEMVDAKSEYGFGEYIQEKFGQEEMGPYLAKYVKPRSRDWADEEIARPYNPDLKYKMIRGKLEKISYSKTPNFVRATSFCRMDNGDDYTLTYTLYENSPYMEVCWNICNKKADSQPEGGWLAFPFNVSAPSFHLGRTGGIVDPAKDFIKNTNHDYFFLNTGLAVVDKSGKGFGLNTPDAPAVSLERPGLFRFSGEFVPKKPNVFVNLFNNQWGTNFTEWIEGSFSAKVYLWSVGHYSHEASLITPVEETRVPLMGVYSEGDGGKLPVSASGVTLSRKGILVTAFGDNIDGEGDVLRLWEQSGESGKCFVALPGNGYRSGQFCNLRGEPIGTPFPIKGNTFIVDVQAYRPLSILLRK